MDDRFILVGIFFSLAGIFLAFAITLRWFMSRRFRRQMRAQMNLADQRHAMLTRQCALSEGWRDLPELPW